MGQKLEALKKREEEARRTPLVHDIIELARRVSRGDQPATMGLLNAVGTWVGRPWQRDRVYVEIAEGTTWQGLVEEFEVLYHPPISAKPIRIDDRVRALAPRVRPGVYEIFTWSDRDQGEGSLRRSDAVKIFVDQNSRGLYAPFLRYLIDYPARGNTTWYTLAPNKIEGRVGAPRLERLYMCDYQVTNLGFDPMPKDRESMGRELFVGARFVE